MFVQLMISLFGIVIVYRILSLVEKTEVISGSILNFLFCFLQLPLFLHLYFKELSTFVLIYIGIFFVTLMVFDKIIGFLSEKTFESLHLYVIDKLILLLKSGKSAQLSSKIIFDEFSGWQKAIFFKISVIFEINSFENYKSGRNQLIQAQFFVELETILRSTSNRIEKLQNFRRSLRVYQNLRHRSRQALQQARAQAAVSLFLYVALIILSKKYLNLDVFSWVMAVSATLFVLGQVILFKLGRKINWKT